MRYRCSPEDVLGHSDRLIKGQREEDEYPEVIFIEDAEELVLPPPQYTDEKVQPAEAKPADAPVA